jgi:predicted AlkP superfamily pyrophosphatase or phosphodiesterase
LAASTIFEKKSRMGQKSLIVVCVLLIMGAGVIAQPGKKMADKPLTTQQQSTKPKLIVGIVIDQMRWDYLYRFNQLYTANGFKRLLSEGFSCDNTLVPYTPTYTAPGHTCIYTGSVPAVHGIVGNNWYDKSRNVNIYCTDDSTATTVGNEPDDAGKMSPDDNNYR